MVRPGQFFVEVNTNKQNKLYKILYNKKIYMFHGIFVKHKNSLIMSFILLFCKY